MKLNKKALSLVLAGMMSIGMMTGCSDSTVEEENNNPSPASTQALRSYSV